MKSEKDNEIELCKIGDVFYKVGKYGITKITITKIEHYPHCVYIDDYRNSYFNRTLLKNCFQTVKRSRIRNTKKKKYCGKEKITKEIRIRIE